MFYNTKVYTLNRICKLFATFYSIIVSPRRILIYTPIRSASIIDCAIKFTAANKFLKKDSTPKASFVATIETVFRTKSLKIAVFYHFIVKIAPR